MMIGIQHIHVNPAGRPNFQYATLINMERPGQEARQQFVCHFSRQTCKHKKPSTESSTFEAHLEKSSHKLRHVQKCQLDTSPLHDPIFTTFVYMYGLCVRGGLTFPPVAHTMAGPTRVHLKAGLVACKGSRQTYMYTLLYALIGHHKMYIHTLLR